MAGARSIDPPPARLPARTRYASSAMDEPRMRPVFTVPLDDPPALLDALKEVLERPDLRCTGTVFRKHAVLQMTEAEQHFWSPHLYLEVRERAEEAGAQEPCMHGRFAPHPHVWTLFMAIYGLLVLGAIAGAVWGLSVWMLGQPPWALLAVPASLGLIAFTYGAAFIGQGLGAQQMYELRKVVDDAVEQTR